MDDLPPVSSLETSVVVPTQSVETPEATAIVIAPQVEPLSSNTVRSHGTTAVNTEFSALDAMKQEETDLINADQDSAASFFLQERVQARKLSQFDNLASHYNGAVSPESPTKVRESLNLELQALQRLPAIDGERIAEISLILKSIESVQRKPNDPRSEDEVVAELIGKAYAAAYAVKETAASPSLISPNSGSPLNSSLPVPETEQSAPDQSSVSSSEQVPSAEDDLESEQEEKSKQREVAEAAFNYFIANPDNSMQQFLDFFFSQKAARGSYERPLKDGEKKDELGWSKVLGEKNSESRDGLSHTLLDYLVESGLIDDYSSKIDLKSSSPHLDLILTSQDTLGQLRNSLSGKLDSKLEEVLSNWLSQKEGIPKIYGKPHTEVSESQKKQLLGEGKGSLLFQSLIMY
jgi:hypothetical protein